MIGFEFKHLLELRVLINPNHLVRGFQAWLDLILNTLELQVLTNLNHLIQGLQAWLDLILNNQ